jgi:thiamine transport system permease protein
VITRAWQRILVGYSLFIVSILILLPLLGLVLAVISRAPALIVNLFTQTGSDNTLAISLTSALRNSLLNATMVSVISVLLALVVGWYANNELTVLSARWLGLGVSLPLGVSAVVLGLGYLITFDSNWANLRQSSALVILAQVTIALPFAYQLIDASWRRLDRNQIQAAQSMGASVLQSLSFVQLPLLRPSIVGAAALSFLISLGDFGAASFIATGDKATLTTTLYRLFSRPGAQNYDLALTASLLFIIVIFLVLYVASIVGTKSRRG